MLAELEEVGLGKSKLEKYLAYVEKMGPALGEEIGKDRRPRPDGGGGTVTRAAATWEEAHEVLVELEGLRAGTRALTAARIGYTDQPTGLGNPEKGKGKGKGVCFEFRDTGRCSKQNCPYRHEKGKGKGKGGRGAPADNSKPNGGGEGQSPSQQAPAQPKAKAKAGAKPGENGQTGGVTNGKKHILCKHVKDPEKFGACPVGGKDCPYSHNRSKFDEKREVDQERWERRERRTEGTKERQRSRGRQGRARYGW